MANKRDVRIALINTGFIESKLNGSEFILMNTTQRININTLCSIIDDYLENDE